MNLLTLIIAMTCSSPIYYSKFESPGANIGIQRTRCETGLGDCFGFTGDIRYCIKELSEL